VHDALVVVFAVGVAHGCGELTLPALSDIRPVHANSVVAISALLFVVHAERVSNLMDRDTNSITAIGGKVDGVAAPSAARGAGPLSDKAVDEAATGRGLHENRWCLWVAYAVAVLFTNLREGQAPWERSLILLDGHFKCIQTPRIDAGVRTPPELIVCPGGATCLHCRFPCGRTVDGIFRDPHSHFLYVLKDQLLS